jgi:ribose transport system substrate-binding protein
MLTKSIFGMGVAALLAAGTVSQALAAGPEQVAGPGADPACFAPVAGDAAYFKWPAREGPYKIALVNGFIAND